MLILKSIKEKEQMKSIWRTAGPAVCIAVMLAVTPSAYASSFLSGSAKIDWSTFSIAGVGITWLDQADKTDAFTTVGSTTDHHSNDLAGWAGVSSSASLPIPGGTVNAGAWTDANVIQQTYAATWSSSSHQENGTAGRFGVFTANATGSVTFSADYALQYQMVLEGSAQGHTSSFAGLRARNYTSATDNMNYDWIGDDKTGPYDSGVVSKAGTLTFLMFFTEGDTGAIGAGVGSSDLLEQWWPPSVPVNPVPEPETYALMLAGLGLIGLVARRRKTKSA